MLLNGPQKSKEAEKEITCQELLKVKEYANLHALSQLSKETEKGVKASKFCSMMGRRHYRKQQIHDSIKFTRLL